MAIKTKPIKLLSDVKINKSLALGAGALAASTIALGIPSIIHNIKMRNNKKRVWNKLTKYFISYFHALC